MEKKISGARSAGAKKAQGAIAQTRLRVSDDIWRGGKWRCGIRGAVTRDVNTKKIWLGGLGKTKNGR